MNRVINTIDKAKVIFSLVLTLGLTVNIANATIVEFRTSLGDFKVNLYDETTPESVANFLNYVNSGAYSNTLFHRSINGFISQGGGFIYDSSWPPSTLQTNPAVNNEPIYSNVRGTIAYAKLGGQPNSATSQWFFNLNNNNSNDPNSLDNQNSGFTVFGEVMDNGMDVIDSIAALTTYPLDTGAFTDIPLQNYTEGEDPNETNIILITEIVIDDPAVNTASGLNPQATNRGNSTSSSGGSGSLGLSILLLLVFTTRFTRS